MDNILDSKYPLAGEKGLPLLHQILEGERAELVSMYRSTLQDQMFTNRGVLSPGMLGRIASEQADALINDVVQPVRDRVLLRGAELSEAGLSEESLLSLGQATRNFLLARLQGNALLPSALQAIDSYHSALLQGFMDDRNKFILVEQERLRSAVQKAQGR